MKEDLKIDESKGECICDVCEGRGSITHGEDRWALSSICWKCQGDGKLDWVSHITGKPDKYYTSSSGMFNGTYTYSCMAGTSGNAACSPSQFQKAHDNAIESAAKHIAEDIDRKIIDDIIKKQQQIPKIEKYYMRG